MLFAYFVLDFMLVDKERPLIFESRAFLRSLLFIFHETVFWLILLGGVLFLKSKVKKLQKSKDEEKVMAPATVLYMLSVAFLGILHIFWYAAPPHLFHLLFVLGDNVTCCCIIFLLASAFTPGKGQLVGAEPDDLMDGNDIIEEDETRASD